MWRARHRSNPKEGGTKCESWSSFRSPYFYPAQGERGGFIVADMRDSSQVAELAERFFLGLNAKIEMTPVMAADDLGKALAGVSGIVRRYG